MTTEDTNTHDLLDGVESALNAAEAERIVAANYQKTTGEELEVLNGESPEIGEFLRAAERKGLSLTVQENDE